MAVSTYYLAAPPASVVPTPVTKVVHPIPRITLESMDGRVRIPLDGSSGWIRMPGSTGLEMPTFDVVASAIPGVAGAVPQDVRTQARAVFIPIYCGTRSDHLSFLQMKDMLRSLVNPLTNTFRIVGTSTRSERELIVTYISGLEGADGADVEGQSWAKFGLNAMAYEPYARDRVDKSLEFLASEDPVPFLGVVGGTDATWPGMLSSTSVIGSDMPVFVNSEVPVYPTLELTGPMDSFEGDLSPVVVNEDGSTTTLTDQVWYVNIPAGIPTGQTFVYVTDPRQRSARLNGGLAAGHVALGSALRPFFPGMNVLNVVAPGSTDESKVRLSWRELHLSLW